MPSLCQALWNSGINEFADLSIERLAAAELAIRQIPGQNISYDYFTLLAGAQMVKADRMIVRFVADAAGVPTVTPLVAKEATIGAAEILRKEFRNIDTRLLDSELWSYESLKAAGNRRKKT